MGRSENIMAYSQFKSFTSQETFLACQLLKYNALECSLSVEKIGDVGIEGEINHIIELKNADSSRNNPLSNSSTDLWKTLYNWAKYFFEHPDYDIAKYELLLYVYSQNECSADIVELIQNCKNHKEFEQLKKEINHKILKNDGLQRRKLSTIEKEYKNENKNRKSSKYFIECLLSKELNDSFEKVVYKFQYYKSEVKYYEGLVRLIKHVYGCEDNIECTNIAIDLLGWVHNKIANLLDNNEPIIICTSEFSEFTKKYIAPKMISNKYKTHYQLEPSIDDINQQLEQSPNYIKQLEIISLNKEVQEGAAFDYLKLLLERENWIKSGYIALINDSKYISFQKMIHKNWKVYKNVIGSNDDLEKGKQIYFKILEMDHGNFDGVKLDQELVRGFIQELANVKVTDQLSVGWHPKYKELLSENDKEEKENE